jgi:hypothetical protein
MAKHTGTDKTLLAMALVGYEAQIAKIKAAIGEIHAKLGHRGSRRPTVTKDVAAPTKRTMSAAGRRRIAAAQRKRWAAVKKSQAQGKSAAKAAAPKKKRKMSAAARKRIGDARKRWAAQRRTVGKTKAVAKTAPKVAAS